jgi:ketosteroid isomerase-like protein
MSTENVEIVRRIYDAVARRDGVTPFELYSEDIVWDHSRHRAVAMYTEPVFHGHEGVRQSWRDGLAAFREVDLALDKLTDAGDDRVLALVREHHVGRASGAPVDGEHYAVWTLAGGKVTRMQIFDEREEALAAAGIRDAPA